MIQPFLFNPNCKVRDNLLGIDIDWNKDDEDLGSIAEFNDLDSYGLHELLISKFLNPTSQQNASPTFQEFADFLAKYPTVKAFGYAVSPNREDYRMALTGLTVEKDDVSPELKADFIKFAEKADEVDFTGDLFCWWD